MADATSSHSSTFSLYNNESVTAMRKRINIAANTEVTISLANQMKKGLIIYVPSAVDVYISDSLALDAANHTQGFLLKQSDYSPFLPTDRAVTAYTTDADVIIYVWESIRDYQG